MKRSISKVSQTDRHAHQSTLDRFVHKAPQTSTHHIKNNDSTSINIKDKSTNQNKRKSSVDSNLSAETVKLPLFNVEFYRNMRESNPSGDYIDNIHKLWWKNYALLEKHHGFIQWIFPNSYKSRFNEKAYPIAHEQIDIFLHDQQVYKRYIKTYQMMLQFYGMVLKDKTTGELKRSRNPHYQERFYKTLITSYHNHMRITRILSSLTLLGFSRFAKKLSLFLKQEIFGEEGALKSLQKIKIYEREWAQFQDIDLEDYEHSDYFKKFEKNEK